MLGRLWIVVVGAMCYASGANSEEISYSVDLRDPPPNTFAHVGGEKSTAIGEIANFDLAIKTTYNFHKDKAEIAKKHAALLAHTSLYNAARIESVTKKLTKFPADFDISRLKFERVTLSVVSLTEIERDGVKLQRIELGANITGSIGQFLRASQDKRYEVWEFDGKKLKLVEAPDDWGILTL